MIANLKPYPEMKDSGVEWLGEMPAHWKARRGKWLFRHRKQINAGGEETNVLSLTLRGVVNNNPESPEGLVPKDYATYQLFCKGDLVFKLIDLENLQTSRVGLVHEDGIMSPAYVRLTPEIALDIRFFYRQYFDLYSRGIYNQLGAGVRSTLGPNDLLELRVLLPPLAEQAKIVRYLDYVGSRVQQFVKAKQKLIRLLEEQKQAIIHRAVTRGLDPDVSLKDSGVEWLGKVPVHWDVRRLRNIVNMRVSNVDKLVKEGEMPVRLCNYVDVYKNDRIDAQMDFMRATATDDEIERFRLAKGDVLITKDSEAWDDIGVPALVTNPAPDLVSGYHLALLRPSAGEIVGRYLFHALQSKGLACQFHVKARGVTRYGLTHPDIKSVWLPLPPLPEQTAIAEYLDKATANIAAAIARTRREIALLQEYHTRLTADVVTGKVDVRDAAANLPNVPETKADFTVEESRA